MPDSPPPQQPRARSAHTHAQAGLPQTVCLEGSDRSPRSLEPRGNEGRARGGVLAAHSTAGPPRPCHLGCNLGLLSAAETHSSLPPTASHTRISAGLPDTTNMWWGWEAAAEAASWDP